MALLRKGRLSMAHKVIAFFNAAIGTAVKQLFIDDASRYDPA